MVFFLTKCLICFFWSRNVFQAEMLSWYSSQYKKTKFSLLIIVRRILILAKKIVPRVFHTPGPRTPGPRPCVFHLAHKCISTLNTPSSIANHSAALPLSYEILLSILANLLSLVWMAPRATSRVSPNQSDPLAKFLHRFLVICNKICFTKIAIHCISYGTKSLAMHIPWCLQGFCKGLRVLGIFEVRTNNTTR